MFGTLIKTLYPTADMDMDVRIDNTGIIVWNESKLGKQPTIAELEARISEVLPALKQQKGLQLKKEVEERLGLHYSPLDLLSLSNLMNEAIATGKTNRAAYLAPLNTWATGVYLLFYPAQAQIIAATTIDEVNAVTIDYTAWEAQKPNISFAEAIAIGD